MVCAISQPPDVSLRSQSESENVLGGTFSVAYGMRSYSPELGRWINRDPIGENGGNNLLSFAWNQCTNRVDVLGLTPTAEEEATEAINTISNRYKFTIAARLSNFSNLIYRMRISHGMVLSWGYQDGNGAKYDRSTREVLIPSGSPYDRDERILHELIHVNNHIFGGSISKTRDEGMAYFFEAYIEALYMFKGLEEMDLCDISAASKTLMRARWKDAWLAVNYAVAPIRVVVPLWPDRDADANDVMNFSGHYGVSLKCRTIARAFNRKLENCGTCLRFTCNADAATGDEISVGHNLPVIFR